MIRMKRTQVTTALAIALVLVLSMLPLLAGAVTTVDTIRLVTTGPGSGGDNESRYPQISADGTTIVFTSRATDLLPTATNNNMNIFVYDVASGATTLVTKGSGSGGNNASYDPRISADGTTIAFYSHATDLLPTATTNTSNVFVYDVVTGVTTLVSAGPGNGGNGWSGSASISGDGARIAFWSQATDLLPTATSGSANIFVYDVATGITTLVTAGPGNGGNGWPFEPQISADGTTIVFTSQATDLLPAATNSNTNVFAYDVVTGVTTLVTKGSGNGGNNWSYNPQISADGTTIAFYSNATDLLPTATSSGANVFVYDVVTGVTTLVTNGSGNGGNSSSYNPRISADGTTITFQSQATDLLPTATNSNANVFVYDVVTGITTLVTKGSGNGGNSSSYESRISADGTTIAFGSWATDLTEDSVNSRRNVFTYDVASDTLTLISKSPSTVDRGSDHPAMSANGKTIAFVSGVSDFPGAETAGGRPNIFLWSRVFSVDVTFDPQNGVEQPFVEAVPQGTAIAAPQAPTAPEGKVFAGWWTQAEGGTQWNFVNPVNNDMTLYAHWSTPQADMVEIFYAATDGGSVTLEEETIPATGAPVGSTAVADSGYDFIGWVGSTFASDEEFEAWLDWLESLEDPMDAIISTDAHFIPPAGENGLWSDAGYIAVFIPTDEVPGGDGSTTPPMGDSTTLWSIAAVALLGCVAVGAATYRKRFEQ